MDGDLSGDYFRQAFPLVPLPEEMRHWDAASIALGIPEAVLMDAASRVALEVLQEELGDLRQRRVLLFMGSGNNGGDAVCLARHLLDAGALPLVLHTKARAAYRGVTGRFLRVAVACGVPCRFLAVRKTGNGGPCWETVAGAAFREPDVLVDGLLGTGFRGQLRGVFDRIIADMNRCCPHAFRLALDVPSGLDAVTGYPCPQAVRADVTVSFQAAKPGLLLPQAREWVGRLQVREIGIPCQAQQRAGAAFRLVDEQCLRWFPEQPQGAYKNSFGHVLVLGGSLGMTGAPQLSARAALGTGAGLVSVGAPEALCAAMRALPDLMTLPLCPGKSWPQTVPSVLLDLLPRCAALVAGPGLGRTEEVVRWVEALCSLPNRPPTVWDADALVALAARPERLRELSAQDILTPHPGEAARLLGISTAAVQADRVGAVRKLAARTPAVCLLKGAGTLICQGTGPVGIAPYDVPALAVAGSGDVLSGCLAACLARGIPAVLAACMGVVLHARAGQILLRRYPQRGNMAGDIAKALPQSLAELVQQVAERRNGRCGN